MEVDSVIICFKGKNILADFFLKYKTNDIVGIMGRNGCGKSSLMKVIFGTFFTKNKFIRINGKVDRQPYQNGNLVAYLPQHGFLPNISINNIIECYITSGCTR